MLLIIIVLAVAAVLLGAWSVSTSIEQRKTVQRSIGAIAEYSTTNVREQEMLEPAGERIIAPIGRFALKIAHRATPVGYLQNVKQKEVLAGNPPGFSVDRFLTLKVFGASAVILWFVLFYGLLGLRGIFVWLLIGFLTFIGFVAPDTSLSRQIQDRQRKIEKELADTLDLLVISVEAGLGFEQALERTAAAVPGPLSDECRRMLQETRMGASRSDALRALDERVRVDDVTTWVLAMLQADRFGISIARILKNQADEMRLRWQQRAQMKAQQAPVKMLFPLAVCIFPALFVVLLMPPMLSILDALR